MSMMIKEAQLMRMLEAGLTSDEAIAEWDRHWRDYLAAVNEYIEAGLIPEPTEET